MKHIEISVKIIGNISPIKWSENQDGRWVRLHSLPCVPDKGVVKLQIDEPLYTDMFVEDTSIKGYEFVLKLTNPLILDETEDIDLMNIFNYATASNIDGVVVGKLVYILKNKKLSFMRYLCADKEENV